MVATISKSFASSETILYQAAVDHEFRAELLHTPDAFGMDHSSLSLPDAVEQQDQTSLKLWSEGLAAVDVYNCASTCSAGIVTVVCDGTTK